MKKTFLIVIFLAILFSCQNENKDTVVAKEISRESYAFLKKANVLSKKYQMEGFLINESKSDTCKISLEIEKDTAIYKCGKKIIIKTYIKPKRITGGEPNNPKEIMDKAFLMAECMVVLRNIKTAGHFCHTPQIDSVEIFTPDSLKKIIKKGFRKSKILIGSDYTSGFYGNVFDAPSGNWGIIAHIEEGMVSGFLIMDNKGIINEIYIANDYYLTIESMKAFFNENEEFVMQVLINNNEKAELILNSEGGYKLNY